MASNEPSQPTQTVTSRHVDALARTVLTSLRTFPSSEMRSRLSQAAHDLASLTVLPGEFDIDAVMEDLRLRRLSHADLMDFCIPEAAFLIGQGWADDRLPFWQVSLSGARLYQLAKRISAEWAGTSGYDARMAVLVVVCEESTHVLGPALLADQLRRAGCSVSSLTAGRGTQIAQVVNQSAFDLVIFTCSSLDVLETVAHLVQQTREETCLVPPMVLGGPVMDYAENIREVTGVDLVTRDIKKALSLCSRSVSGHMELKVAE